MELRVALFLSSLIILASSICGSASISSKSLLGVAPEDEKYYTTSSGTIKCKDGSRKFSLSQLNDDYCDCPDGTDEPGTSACPYGRFYCKNAGHAPLLIYSSRVNDGICDCCDGSDEYDGKIKCQDTCWEAGKVARDKLKKKIAVHKEGVAIRRREVEQAKLAIAKDEAELSKLKNEEKILKGLVEQLKKRKEQIEKAEENERLQKEKEERERKEAAEAEAEKTKANERADTPDGESTESAKNDKVDLLEDSNDNDKISPSDQLTNDDKIRQSEDPANDDQIGLLEDSPDVVEHHGHSVTEFDHSDKSKSDGSPNSGEEEVKDFSQDESIRQGDSVAADITGLDTGSKEKDASDGSESLSKEELGRLVASRWTGEKTEQPTEEVDGAEDVDPENHEDTPNAAHDEEYNGYDSETEDDRHKYDDDDFEDQMEDFKEDDHGDSSSSYKSDSDDESDMSDLTSTSNPSWLEKIQHTVRSILQAVNLFQTPVDKSEAAHVRKEYDQSSAKLSKIQSRISSLTQKLKHDFGPEKEFYSFYGQCFESKENKYVYKVCPFKQASQVEGHSTTRLGSWDKFEDSYRTMLFLNGDKCWNGPDRSMKVKLRCGLKNEVADVDEPSRCEYLALLSTPALCQEEKLKELQDKLESMNKEQPQGRDEL